MTLDPEVKSAMRVLAAHGATLHYICYVDSPTGRYRCDLYPNCDGCGHPVCYRRHVVRMPEVAVKPGEGVKE